VDGGRLIVARQPWRTLLMRTEGEFLHLRGGLDVFADETDFVFPFDARAPVPPGNDQSHGSAVILREGVSIHFGGEEGAGGMNLFARKDPACAGLGCERRRIV